MSISMSQANRLQVEEKLKQYIWKNRVLVLITPAEGDQAFTHQKRLIRAVQRAVQDRDMVVMNLEYNKLSPEDQHYINQKFNASGKSFKLVLIGKDGGVKLESEEPLSMDTVFQTIDAMPMRRQEMRKNG